VAVLALGLAAVGCAGAAAADRATVRLEGRPPVVVAGTPWTARLVVSPPSAGRPRLVARRAAARRTFRATRASAGRFRIRVVLPTAGRWTLEARLGRRRHPLGTVTVRPPAADVEEPFAVALAPGGGVLVADRAAHRIWRLDPSSARRTLVAGNGRPGFGGDGGPATEAAIGEPIDVVAGPRGDVYVVSELRIRRISAATGVIDTVAGTGERAFSGDGGPTTVAALNAPDSLAFDGAGNLYVAEYENRVRRIDAGTGVISTVVGNGAEGFSGDGGPARNALISHPHGLAVAAGGTIYLADTWNQRIRRVDPAGTITTVAGTGAQGHGGDGGPAARAVFDDPVHVALGPDGALYVSDGSNNRIRRVGADGVVRTVAGGGGATSPGDGGPATRARLALPNAVAVAPDGTFYVAEFEGRRVRRVDGRTGVITTIAR
jgi:serine/threonine-protein kinase